MRKLMALILVLIVAVVHGQSLDYFIGRLITGGKAQEIYYDRNQYNNIPGVFQTEYRVMDKNRKMLYDIVMAHDPKKGDIVVAITLPGTAAKTAIIRYDAQDAGLVLSDMGSGYTAFNDTGNYKYVISFTDVNRDYPAAHRLRLPDGKQVVLDPLTRIRLKKHNEILKSPEVTDYVAKKQKAAREAKLRGVAPVPDRNTYSGELWGMKPIVKSSVSVDDFSVSIMRLRDTLYAKYNTLNTAVAMVKAQLVKDGAFAKDAKGKPGSEQYNGEKKGGKPAGKGVMVMDANIYSGNFDRGKLIAGKALVIDDAGEYCGDYTNGEMNGTGKMEYKNGMVLLGTFDRGNFTTGLIKSKDRDGGIFFGNYNGNQRKGYGELTTKAGSLLYGEFSSGQLTRGYIKEPLKDGSFSYYKVVDGVKKPADPSTASDFFDAATARK